MKKTKFHFTIPGTQTCMALGGYVRSKTASETELGTLKTVTSLRFEWENGTESKGTGTLRQVIILTILSVMM